MMGESLGTETEAGESLGTETEAAPGLGLAEGVTAAGGEVSL
jgi:hypothetical protein